MTLNATARQTDVGTTHTDRWFFLIKIARSGKGRKIMNDLENLVKQFGAIVEEERRSLEWYKLQKQTLFGDGIEPAFMYESFGKTIVHFRKGLPKLIEKYGLESHEKEYPLVEGKKLIATFGNLEFWQEATTERSYIFE